MAGKGGNPNWRDASGKGVSGNPGGKKRSDYAVKHLAQTYTEEALKRLVDIMRQEDDLRAAASAANAVLDRGWGKPAQAIIGGGEDDPPISVTEIIIRAIDAAGDRPPEKGG